MGDVDAQIRIAKMCDYGQGIEQDKLEAARWYEEAAKNGLVQEKNQ
jgi:TPR repeat protein